MIPQRQVDEIIEKNDIGDVISEYVKLERKGSGFTGLCPFHNEKTPSFSVHEGKQIFKCFGCGKGGNVVNFIMYAENLSYYQALEYLAKRAGIQIQKNVTKADVEKDKIKNDIFTVNKVAARYFYDCLKKSPEAQRYLYDRGIKFDTVKKFGLGYAPDSWDSLYKHFMESGISPEPKLLETAGLITSRKEKNGYFDKFRNRIIFPIFDVSGNVIAFGGRVMDDSLPKYLNSPETLAYSKGNNLYALNVAKKAQSDRVIIVEGYMDCIALHKAGIDWAVASLGTALTTKQAALLKKYFNEVIIGYDADSAGQKATMRGLDILEQAGFRVRVLTLGDVDKKVKDPDEFLRKHTADEFLEVVSKAKSLIEYKISKAEEQYPTNTIESKGMFLNASVRILASIKSETQRDMYLDWFSKKYNTSKAALANEIEVVLSGGTLEDRSQRKKRVAVSQTEETQNPIEMSADQIKLDKYEKTLVLLLSDDRQAMTRYFNEVRKLIENSDNIQLLDMLKERYDSNRKTGTEAVLADAAQLNEYNSKVLAEIVSKWLKPKQISQTIEALVKKCGLLNCNIKISVLSEMIKNQNLNKEERNALMQEIALIIIERKKYENGK